MTGLQDIIGEDAAVAALRGFLAAGRLPHALLLAGPEGVGRRTTAEALAAVLLCPCADPAAGRACGGCDDCRHLAAGTHPDLHVIYKELGRYHDDPDVRNRTMQQLGIDVIRQFLITPAHRASSRGRGKVFIVREAERMSPAAQNALLKTLEEPPPGVTLMLLCERAEQMLPTTRSRCAPLRFGPLPRDWVAEKLAAAGVAAEEAAFWAAFTEGSVGRSLRLAAAGLYETKRDIVDRLGALPSAGDADLGEQWAKLMEARAKQDVKEQKQQAEGGPEPSQMLASRRAAAWMLRVIASAVRDALLLRTDADEALTNADQAEPVEALSQRFGPAELAQILQDLSRYEELLWRNVNPKVVWDNVVISCASGAPARA